MRFDPEIQRLAPQQALRWLKNGKMHFNKKNILNDKDLIYFSSEPSYKVRVLSQ